MANGIIINFHNETDPVIFEQTLLALKAWFRIVNFEELKSLVKSNADTRNVCHITFDDGELGFSNIVFPLLKKHNVPVSLFVSPKVVASQENFWFQRIEKADTAVIKKILVERTGIPLIQLEPFDNLSIFKCLAMKDILPVVEDYESTLRSVDTKPKNVNLEQLIELEASGLVSVGAHTLSHPILRNEDDKSCEEEIGGSIKQLEQLLGHPIKSFAYPNGRPELDFGERERLLLEKYGIDIGFSTRFDKLVTTDKLSLPRMGFARMGLNPGNPLIRLRLQLGRAWPDIKTIGGPDETATRNRIYALIARYKS